MKKITFAYHKTKGKKSTKKIYVTEMTGRGNYIKMIIRVKCFIKSRREKPVNIYLTRELKIKNTEKGAHCLNV